MATIQEIQEEDGTWLFVVPVSGLVLTKAVNFEYKVDQVKFVSASRLPGRRKKFGFPVKLSELQNKHHGILKGFFSEEETYATLRLRGKGSDLKEKFLKLVREELAIISISQLGYSRRRHNSFPAMSREYRPAQLSSLMLNTNRMSWTQLNETTGKLSNLLLDGAWKDFCKQVFFFNLVRIISGEIQVKNTWRKDVRNAAILAGQSQCSSDIPQCFLWNMIAIELLLTQQGDTYKEALPERAEAFIGWATDWELENYENRISEAYKKRCKFVHDGNRDSINIQDVLFTDGLLFNVITNIIKHPKIFYSKKQLIDFSEKVKAEHLLGIRQKVRPKSLQYMNINYQEEDYKKI